MGEAGLNSMLLRAHQLVALRRWEEAAAILGQVVASDPTNAYGHRLLSSCFLNLERFDDALREADAAIALDPTAEWSFRLRSAALIGLRKKRAAVEAAREAVRLAPEQPAAFVQLATACGAAGQWQDARVAAEQAVRLAPNSAGAFNTLGVTALRTGRIPAAEAAFRKALQIDPNDPSALNNLGLVARARGRRGEAHDLYGASSRADPRSGIGFRNAARMSNSLVREALVGAGMTCYAAVWRLGSEAPRVPALWIPTALCALGVVACVWLWRRVRDQYRPRLLKLTVRPIGYVAAGAIAFAFGTAVGFLSTSHYGTLAATWCFLVYAGPVGLPKWSGRPRTKTSLERARRRDRRVRYVVNGTLIFLITVCGLIAVAALVELVVGSRSDPTSDIVAGLVGALLIGIVLLLILIRVMLPITRDGKDPGLLDELEADLAAERSGASGEARQP